MDDASPRRDYIFLSSLRVGAREQSQGIGGENLVSAPVQRGEFSIPVPRVDVPVAVELLVDANVDGVPSVGERYVRWLDPKVPLRTELDQTGLTRDASDRPEGREDRARKGGGSP